MLNVSDDGKKAVVVEVNAETDFVAKNEKFQAMLRKLQTGINTTAADDRRHSWLSHGNSIPRQLVKKIANRREHEHPSFPGRTVSLLLILIWGKNRC